jgi:hypothetical protein
MRSLEITVTVRSHHQNFNWSPTLFLHFCDYLPFKDSLALSLNSLESPSCKTALYQDWLKLVSWFRRRFLKILSNINTYNIVFPIMALFDTQGLYFEQTWICIKGSFHPTQFLYFYDYLPIEDDLALYLNDFEFLATKNDLLQVWFKLACCMVLEKI